jgi:DNA-binding response OmpR family regulator
MSQRAAGAVMKPASVLITEDDPFTRRLLAALFEKNGYRVEQAASGREMHQKLASVAIDLVLLDLHLPDEDGLVLLRQIRALSAVPVIIVSARGEDADRIAGLELGADDYVPKSWTPRELMARAISVLKRTGANQDRASDLDRYLTFAEYRLDVEGHSLTGSQGNEIRLTAAEFRLLHALVRAKGRTLRRDQLLDALSAGSDAPYDRTIDVLISRLRKKIEPDATKPRMIRTVAGVGYQLVDR